MPIASDTDKCVQSNDSIDEELSSNRPVDISLDSTPGKHDSTTEGTGTLTVKKASGSGRMSAQTRFSSTNSSAIRALNTTVGVTDTEKPDIRLWLLQNQLSTLREEVQWFQSTLKTTVQDFVEEWKQESDNVSTKASRNENAWNTQFSHLTRHIQQQIQDTKRYCRDDLVKKQILVLERSILGKVASEHLLPVQEHYRELETAIQYQSNELRDAIDKQQAVISTLEKSVNVRKIIIEGLERQIQTFGNELTGLQKEWKNMALSLDDTSVKLVDTVQSLSEQWKEQQQVLLTTMGQQETSLFTWETTLNSRYSEHEHLFSQVQDQDSIIKSLRSKLDAAVEELDLAKWKMDEILEEQKIHHKNLETIEIEHSNALHAVQQELATTQQELRQYQADKEREQSLLDQELDERQEVFDQLQKTVQIQQTELAAVRAELDTSKVERDEVRKEIAKNMEMQNTLFDYLMKQVQSQSHEIKETNSSLSSVQRHYDSVVSKLEKRIDDHDTEKEIISNKIREQAAESQKAREEREALRTLIKTNMETCMSKDKELHDHLLQHCKDRDASFLQLDEAHTKLVGIMSVRETLINSFLQHIQKHSSAISEIKENAKFNKDEIKDVMHNSLQNVRSEIQTSNEKIVNLDKKIDCQTKELSHDLQKLQHVVQMETNERNDASLKVQKDIEAQKVEIVGLQQKLVKKTDDVDKLETDISSLRKDILSVNALNSETANNLSREVESRDIQFVQLVDQVQHQSQELEDVVEKQIEFKKEMESKMDVRNVMFQHLVKQVQQQVDEFNKFKINDDISHVVVNERIQSASHRIDQISCQLTERCDQVDTQLENGLSSINKQLTNLEESTVEEKTRLSESRKDIEKTLSLRQALFDQLVRQVQNHILESNKSKEEQVDVKRLVDVAVNNAKDLRIDSINEQIKDLSEYIHVEKEERVQNQSDLIVMVEQESTAVRLELNALLENKIANQNNEFAERLLEFVKQEQLQKGGEVYDQKFMQSDVSLKELQAQVLDHASRIDKATADIADAQCAGDKVNADLANAKAAHEVDVNDLLRRLQDCDDSLATVKDDVTRDRDNMIAMKLLQESLSHQIEEQVGRLKHQLKSHALKDITSPDYVTVDEFRSQSEELKSAISEMSKREQTRDILLIDESTENRCNEGPDIESSDTRGSTRQYHNLMKRIEMSKKAIRELQLDININSSNESSGSASGNGSSDIRNKNDDESRPHQMNSTEYNILRSQIIVAGATSKDILKKVEALESRISDIIAESLERINLDGVKNDERRLLVETRDDQYHTDDVAQHLSELQSIRTEIMDALRKRDEHMSALEVRLDEQNNREGDEKELWTEQKINELEHRVLDLAQELRVSRESLEIELEHKNSSLKKVEHKLETASEKLKETK